MRAANRIGRTMAVMAVIGLVLPTSHVRAERTGSPPGGPSRIRHHSVIRDVALRPGGVLQGRVLTADGRPQPDVDVGIFRGTKIVTRVRTGAVGQFTVGSLRGGVYRVTAAQVEGVVRLWAPKTAPPRAKHQLWIVSGPVTRAQMHPAAAIMGSPLLITGLVAAAVAIPVAIHNNQSDRRSGS